jgi:hypothetical protein
LKKLNCEKKPIKILKNRLVWFQFYKPETEKTEANPNRKKLEKTKPNNKTESKPSQIKKPSQTDFDLVIFLIKTKPNRK